MDEALVEDGLIRTVAAVIADGRGRVLLVRKRGSEIFIQPGGKREPGEDSLGEPLNNSARSAFQSEKPQIVWCDPSDSSRSYGRGAQRARCGFSGETLTGRVFAGSPPRLGSLIWNDQTTLAQAKPETPAKTRRARAELFRGSLATLARELREEIGVGFDPARAVRLGEFEERAVHEPGRRVRAEAFVVAIDDVPRAAAEIEELAWVDPGDPGELNLAPLSRRHILPAFMDQREIAT